MLVLARKKNGVVMIGDDIEVTVLEVRGDTVRLGFNAPGNIAVHRKEIWMKIKNGKELLCDGSAGQSVGG